MSLYGAMFSGVSGLNANSQALGAIADNITNVNTVGYKATEMRFQTLVTAQASSNSYNPGGVQQNPFAAIDVQGLFTATLNATDLALAGDGFFVVNESAANAGSTGFNFTRAGAFNADKSGFLKNTAGQFLQGYKTNSTGQTVDSTNTVFNPDPTVFTNLETIRLNNIGGTADATDNLTFGANLNAEDDVGATGNTTVQVFDSLGVAHNVALTWTKKDNNQWDLSVEPPAGGQNATLLNSAGAVYASTGRLDFGSAPADGELVTVNFNTGGAAVVFEFDTNGSVTGSNTAVTFTAGDAAAAASRFVTLFNAADTAGTTAARAAVSNTRVNITNTTTASEDAKALDITVTVGGLNGASAINQFGGGAFTVRDLDLPTATTPAINFDGSGIPTAFNVDDIAIATNNGSADLAIDFSFGTVGQANGITQFAASYNPTFIDTDGAAFGQFSGVVIGESGLVTALFQNGDIRPIFQIPIATFPNPNGLGASTGNVYSQTDFSGLMFLRNGGVGGAGKVQNSVLEASTVDIAKEFTQMITTQRAYSASAKIISTADEMLGELMRIKR